METHLSIALTGCVPELGHRFFLPAMELAHNLALGDDTIRLKLEMNALQQPQVLILDEVGYLSFDSVQTCLLFQVIARRDHRHKA
ncbi:MAG: ATP-binding protein [Nitrospirota bacterium]|nr:ATP-binding protein [Nitrospirota bacterium]